MSNVVACPNKFFLLTLLSYGHWSVGGWVNLCGAKKLNSKCQIFENISDIVN